MTSQHPPGLQRFVLVVAGWATRVAHVLGPTCWLLGLTKHSRALDAGDRPPPFVDTDATWLIVPDGRP